MAAADAPSSSSQSESLPTVAVSAATVEGLASVIADHVGMVAKKARKERICTAKERISRMPPCAAGKRSSIYRGVTRHRWTGRYEAHLWDKSIWNQNQNKKGKQVYLGAYDDEEAAARAYDLAALKYWGAGTLINFPVNDYSRDLEGMQMISKEDYLASLRRKSSAFSRGIPKYRGVPSQNQSNPWEASCNLMFGNNYFNNINCSGFCPERKIDLTSYISWWDSSTNGRQSNSDNAAINTDERTTEFAVSATEPYKLPSFGNHNKGNNTISATSILSRSPAFKTFEEKIVKEEAPVSFEDVGIIEDLGINLGSNEPPPPSASRSYTLASILSAPLSTSWSDIDTDQDHVFW